MLSKFGEGEKVTHFCKIFGMEPSLHKDLLANRGISWPRGVRSFRSRFGSKSLRNKYWFHAESFPKVNHFFADPSTVLVSNSSYTAPIFKNFGVLESPRAVDVENDQKQGERTSFDG